MPINEITPKEEIQTCLMIKVLEVIAEILDGSDLTLDFLGCSHWTNWPIFEQVKQRGPFFLFISTLTTFMVGLTAVEA